MTMRKVTTDLEQRLARRYGGPDYTFLTQVRNGTGFARDVRTADALAMSTYPSRGIYLHGFEIKASRGDWLRELKDPDKADEIAKFCNFWWIVAPKDVVKEGELPADWGLLVPRGESLVCVTQATKKHALPMTNLMLASILRKVKESMVPATVVDQRVEAEVNDRVAGRVAHVAHELERVKERLALYEKFEAESGIHLAEWNYGNVKDSMRVIQRLLLDPQGYYDGMSDIKIRIDMMSRSIEAAMDEIKQRLEAEHVG